MNGLLCGYGSYVFFFILYEEYLLLLDEKFIHEETNQVIQGDQAVILRYLLHAEAVNAALFLLCSLMGVAVICFFFFHCYLVAINCTTNEFFKWRSHRSQQLEEKQTEEMEMHHLYGLGSIRANVLEIWRPRYLAKVQNVANQRQKQRRQEE